MLASALAVAAHPAHLHAIDLASGGEDSGEDTGKDPEIELLHRKSKGKGKGKAQPQLAKDLFEAKGSFDTRIDFINIKNEQTEQAKRITIDNDPDPLGCIDLTKQEETAALAAGKKSLPPPNAAEGKFKDVFAALDAASNELDGKKGKKEDPEAKARSKDRQAGKKYGYTALEAFAREEAKNFPANAAALQEARKRRDEFKIAQEQHQKVTSRALHRSSNENNLGNGKSLSSKQRKAAEGRKNIGMHFCSSPSHGDAVAVLHKIVGHVQKSKLRTDEHNATLRQERGAKAPDAHHGPGERKWICKTVDAESGDCTMPDGDGEFTTVGWDESYLLVYDR
jgi:hypothetical protein